MYSTFEQNLFHFCRVSHSACFVNMSRNTGDTIHKHGSGLRTWFVSFDASYLNFSSSSSSPRLRALLRCVPFRRWQYVCHICLASTYSKHVVCLTRHLFSLFSSSAFLLFCHLFSAILSRSYSFLSTSVYYFFCLLLSSSFLVWFVRTAHLKPMRKWWVECFPSLLFVIFVWRNLTAQCQLSLSALFQCQFYCCCCRQLYALMYFVSRTYLVVATWQSQRDTGWSF